MVHGKKTLAGLFIAGLLGFLFSVFSLFVRSNVMYAPPEMMGGRTSTADNFMGLVAGIVILFIAGVVLYLIRRRQEPPQMPE